MKQIIADLFKQIHGREPSVITRAPGRIEFIGNHTDYNGGTVLGASIDRGVTVAVAPRTDGKRNFYSMFTGQTVTLDAAVTMKQHGEASWVNYPLGVIAAMPAFGLQTPQGFDYVAMSDLPTGAGLSSSAAIELASGLAFLAITGQQADRETLVKIGKHAENNFVGVPCGILDQGVSGFGKAGHLVFIDCRGPRFDTVPMPAGAHFWIFNTHTKHALVDGLYSARHRECMEAAKALGVSLLVEAKPAQLDAAKDKLSADSYNRAKHVIEEIARVDLTVKSLENGDLTTVGGLLTASHRSSQNFFGNSTEELDFLVDKLTTTDHVFGARLTGGGFGGAVMALTSDSFGETQAHAVAAAYEKKYGAKPDILHMLTGDGATEL
ncbi:MAG: galactokinase [Opitutaceae bacterium]|nr:galactokinase [Opitutaceae bacterium]